MQYRPAIDGLRTIAVVPVIAFHAGFSMLRGGYVGVDIFFVISGYLITSLLMDDLAGGRFSIVTFYERRARRILPALFVVVACCLPFAWLWIFPQQMIQFGRSIAAVALFSSNILFWREDDYFALASEEKPLLHTWSLAVEEQYYLLFPLALWMIWKWGRRPAFGVIAFMAAGSLAINELMLHMPDVSRLAVFFLAPTRAWELLAGSLCAFTLHQRPQPSNGWLAALGLSLIAYANLAYDHQTPFPSLYALIPVGGTALIILFAGQGTFVQRLLSSRPFVGIGLISYSAYLWHQPLFAFARIRAIGTPSAWIMAGLACASFILAWASWRWIERPFRLKESAGGFSRRAIFIGSATGMTIMLMVAAVIEWQRGFPQRVAPQVAVALSAAKDAGPFNACLELTPDVPQCALGDKGRDKVDFLLIGDSIAGAMGEALDLSAARHHRRGVIYATKACPALLHTGGTIASTSALCERMQASMVEEARKRGVHTVFLTSAWSQLDPDRRCELSTMVCGPTEQMEATVAENIRATVRAFRRAGIEPVFVGMAPRAERSVPFALAKQIQYGDGAGMLTAQSESYKNPVDMMGMRGGTIYGAPYVDVSRAFCRAGRCLLARGGHALLMDPIHVTSGTARTLSPLFDGPMQAMR